MSWYGDLAKWAGKLVLGAGAVYGGYKYAQHHASQSFKSTNCIRFSLPFLEESTLGNSIFDTYMRAVHPDRKMNFLLVPKLKDDTLKLENVTRGDDFVYDESGKKIKCALLWAYGAETDERAYDLNPEKSEAFEKEGKYRTVWVDKDAFFAAMEKRPQIIEEARKHFEGQTFIGRSHDLRAFNLRAHGHASVAAGGNLLWGVGLGAAALAVAVIGLFSPLALVGAVALAGTGAVLAFGGGAGGEREASVSAGSHDAGGAVSKPGSDQSYVPDLPSLTPGTRVTLHDQPEPSPGAMKVDMPIKMGSLLVSSVEGAPERSQATPPVPAAGDKSPPRGPEIV